MDSFEKKHERGINNMGELLLKGYIMTAQACPVCNCPFFKKTSNSPPFCPLCDDKKENKEKENLKEKEQMEQMEQMMSKESKINEFQTEKKEVSNTNSKKQDSINSKMSELLLAGWTLTNDNCPFCIGVPLMKNKEKQQFCVKCEKYFISEEEAKKQGITIKDEKTENNDKQISTLYNRNEPITKNKAIKHSLDIEDKVTQSINKEIIPPIKKEKKEINSITDEVKVECSKTSVALINQLSLLRSKLEVLNEKDDAFSNTQYIINICDTISSVAKALEACNTILNN
ncbi:hypothetical protein BCR36DRAFT_401287 [Piromyces finnis]|uniref:Sjogrens syndrome scleroderma autoantigen 1 n=1 Tax=Piromyces finnis TaxID=1754191 RepID=A0A1Y1VNM9_9FUNG|nr:hypothetical protein BCR36DRAFT_401287 [Piromyces finnis]|eukprot:ORX61015.1 hypothetical protein BCR36DRAFT_401287 [Piromyces finnis]